MDSVINKQIFRCFPVKVFFILMCVVALMVPVSADPFSPQTQPDQNSLTLAVNSSASVPDSPVNSGTMISADQNAGKEVSGVMVVPVKKSKIPSGYQMVNRIIKSATSRF